MDRGYARTPMGLQHYITAGNDGDAIVLLGSAGRSSRMFMDLVEHLSSRYRAIAVDVLGSGASDPLPPGATMQTLGNSVIALLDALHIDRAHLFGLHTGNKIGSAAAASAPDRVLSFVLCGQTHSIVPDREVRNHGIGDRAKTYAGGLDDEASRLIAWSMLSQRMSDLWWRADGFSSGDFAAAVEHVKRHALDELESFQAVPLMYAMNFAYDIVADWARIRVPTLVLEITTPREDALYGRQAKAVAGLISGAVTATMESTGYKHTFEDRAMELAETISGFC